MQTYTPTAAAKLLYQLQSSGSIVRAAFGSAGTAMCGWNGDV
jgi:hypothetical protein